MIQDGRALRLEAVPKELHHRRGAIQHLSSTLKPISHGLGGDDSFITGPSGSGKTTLARYVVEQLEGQTINIRTGYVNCMGDSSAASVLHSLLRDAGIGIDFKREGTSRAAYLDRIRDLDDELVFIIDEVDFLEEYDVLGTLYERPNVSMILICIDKDPLFARIQHSGINNRLRTAENIRLERYTHDELLDIVWDRVDYGLTPGSIEEDAVERLVDIAAGDARFAIAILRRAVKSVLGGTERVTVDEVEDAVQDAREDVQRRTVERLSTHQRLLYTIIEEAGEIHASELHARYETEATNPKSRRTRRRYLNDLKRYELIQQKGRKSGTAYITTSKR